MAKKPTAPTISATIIVNIVEPGTLGVTISADGGSMPSDWQQMALTWMMNCLQVRDHVLNETQVRRVTDLLDRILTRITALEAKGVRQMANIADIQEKIAQLTTVVEDGTTVEASVEALLTGQTAMLVDIKAQLAAALASNDPAALQAVVDALDALTMTSQDTLDKTVAAVVANTPAAE